MLILAFIFQHFSETVIKSTFHPSEVFDENKLIYDNFNPVEMGIYAMFVNIWGRIIYLYTHPYTP